MPRSYLLWSFAGNRNEQSQANEEARNGPTKEGRKLVEFIFATIPVCIGVYVYILLRYSYRLQRRLRRTTSLNILRYDRLARSLRRIRENDMNETEMRNHGRRCAQFLRRAANNIRINASLRQHRKSYFLTNCISVHNMFLEIRNMFVSTRAKICILCII